MTWGEIEGTPFRLDASDMVAPTSAPAFKVSYLNSVILKTVF